MTLEQALKWKCGSFSDYENILNEQEKMLKRVRKLNLEIEKTEDAKSCFDYNDLNSRDKWIQYDNKLKRLSKEKELIRLCIKENDERIAREFY